MTDSLKRYCIMPSCKGEKFDLVHKFPRNDTRAREWLSIINIPEISVMPLNQIRKSKFICTRHFAPDAYKHVESRSLNITAVPSRNLLGRLETLDHIINRERKVRNGTVSHKNMMFDESEIAEKFFQIEGTSEVHELVIVPTRKNLTDELNKVIQDQENPVKRRKVVQEESWEETCREPSPIEILDINDVILPLTNPLDEIMEEREIQEEVPVDPVIDNDPKLAFLEIEDETKYPGGIRLNHFWLRDHCQCDKCYDKDKAQRKFNLTDINLDIRPLEYSIEEEQLRVKWPDEHESFYELDFLYNSQYVVRRPLYEETHAELWNQETIQTMDVASVDLSDLLCNEASVKTVLTSLVKFGVAFINKVPATQHSTEMTITRLFPLMKTFLGEMWTSSDTKDPGKLIDFELFFGDFFFRWKINYFNFFFVDLYLWKKKQKNSNKFFNIFFVKIIFL